MREQQNQISQLLYVLKMIKRKYTIKNLSGFTLIELLIVMGIVGILAGMSIFAMQGARESARDARRKGDLEAIATAVEIYKSDCHAYPAALASPLTSNCTGSLVTYMEETPIDPVSGALYYYDNPTSVTYVLCSHLEDPPSPANTTTGCGTCDPSNCEYRLLNP